MKKVIAIFILLFVCWFFACGAHAQEYFDSTYKITHDSIISKIVTYHKDTIVFVSVPVTHDSTFLAQEKVRRWWGYKWRTIMLTTKVYHDSTYPVQQSVPYYKNELFSIKTTHDTTETKVRNVVINFGVLSSFRDIDAKINAANNLGVDHVRSGITLETFTGKSLEVRTFLDEGYKIVLNINQCQTNNPNKPCYFPKNLTLYESQLRSVLNTYKTELVVIENEELNDYNPESKAPLHHWGSLQDYINQLAVAVRVCKEYNQPVTNGGLTQEVVTSLHYYYERNGLTDSINWLKTSMGGGINRDYLRAERCDSLLRAYKQLDLSYVNLQWYEPHITRGHVTNILGVVCDYIEQQTGKRVITNETGVRTYEAEHTAALTQQWIAVGAMFVILYDPPKPGEGENSHPFTTPEGNLLSNGIIFKSTVIQEAEY